MLLSLIVSVSLPGAAADPSNAVLLGSYNAPAVHGLVLDPQGLPVSGAKVTVRTKNGSVVDVYTTGSNGAFHFDHLPDDDYYVNVVASGFAAEEVSISTAQTADDIDLSVRLGIPCSSSVEGGAPLSESDRQALLELMIAAASVNRGKHLFSSRNTEGLRLPRLEGVRFVLLTPGQIQRESRRRDLFYYEVSKITGSRLCATAVLHYNCVVEGELANLCGEHFVFEFRNVENTWRVRVVTGGIARR